MGASNSLPEPEDIPLADRQACLQSVDLDGVVAALAEAERVVCLCGAGISVSAGIPDFRSPGTGLYSQLAKYNLPTPESVFDITYFRDDPAPFSLLAKEMFPGGHKPTATHASKFLRTLS